MKNICLFLGAGLMAVLVGCATTPVAVVVPVGPNPAGGKSLASEGGLQVFSRLAERTDDQNQASRDDVWYQHTDYYIYNLQHRLVKRVDNTIGHYEEAPRVVTLPPGKYLVKAEANDDSWVNVPVMIEPGRTTRIHLDDNWPVPAYASKNDLVSLPNGYPIGWQAK
jgi:hypothetical protein